MKEMNYIVAVKDSSENGYSEYKRFINFSDAEKFILGHDPESGTYYILQDGIIISTYEGDK